MSSRHPGFHLIWLSALDAGPRESIGLMRNVATATDQGIEGEYVLNKS